MIKGYTLKRIRLINFHNFLNETITINGHLFLIGGNGSGKTTILDAVHFVLTAGKHNMELNSAARMAGQPRNLGRTLQGIFLRYDLEKGQRNEDKTIGYAALEFEKPNSKERFCIGCGARATNLQTAPEIWGFEAQTSLDQLELTSKPGDKVIPLNQDELKTRNCKVYKRDRYVEVIADKFFDNRASYDETMNLIAAGKSYRELVSRFQDQSQLFRELLPPPDKDAYIRIQSSLQDIEKMQAGLEDQKAKLDVLDDLEIELAEATKQRERIARLTYINADFRLQRAKADSDIAADDEKKAEQDFAANNAQLQTHEHKLNLIDSQIDAIKNSDVYKNKILVHQWHGELGKNRVSVQDIESRIEGHRGDLINLQTRSSDIWQSLEDFWQQLAAQFENSQQFSTEEIPFMQDRQEHSYAQQYNLLRDKLIPVRDIHSSEIAGLEHEIGQFQKRITDFEKQISRMQKQKEAVPEAARFAELEMRLADEKIEYIPFFRALEPTGDMTDGIGRVVEELIGPQRLCAILIAGSQLKKARAAVIAEAYNIPVIDYSEAASPAPPPGGLRRFLNFQGTFAIEAENYAASILDKYRFIGSDDALMHSQENNLVSRDGLIREQGSLRRVEATNNRFIGSAAREATRREQIEELEAKVNTAEIELKILKEKLSENRHRHTGLVKALDSLQALSPEIFNKYEKDIFEIETRIEAANTRLHADENRHKELSLEQESLQEKIRVIEAQAGSADYAVVADKLTMLSATKKELEGQIGEGHRRQGSLETTISIRKNDIARTLMNVTFKSEEFVKSQKRLLEVVKGVEEGGLNQYVYVTQRGQQIKPVNYATLLLDAEKDSAAQSQKIRSLLLQNPIIQRDFRFQFDDISLQISDGDGKSLEKLNKQHRDHYDEACQILEKKNYELFENLIYNDIVRRLCREEENLDKTIKEMNAQLRELKFGNTTYSFKMQLRDEFKEFSELIHKASVTDEDSRKALRNYFEAHRQSLVREGDSLPDFLDYRKWHDVVLQAGSGNSEGVILTRKRLSFGSGGEQSVPNYILLLSLAKVHLDHTNSRIRIILMDEAFYGIDAQRREELLSFADHLDVSLIIAHPELDGVTEALTSTTTLLIEKTHEGDVYIGNFDFAKKLPQGLFDEPTSEPDAIIKLN